MDDPTPTEAISESNMSNTGEKNMDNPTQSTETYSAAGGDNGTAHEPTNEDTEQSTDLGESANSTAQEPQETVDGAAQPARDLKANILTRMRSDATSAKSEDPMWRAFFDTRKNCGRDERWVWIVGKFCFLGPSLDHSFFSFIYYPVSVILPTSLKAAPTSVTNLELSDSSPTDR